MEEDAVGTFSSEPSLRPVDTGTAGQAREQLVMAAFAEYSGKLTSFAFALTRDRDAADDLVQETFLRLVREAGDGREPENVGAWLFRVCANLATSRGRRLTVARRWLSGVRSLQHEPSADLPALKREANDALLTGLSMLPADARAALLMAANGFSGREIADAIGRTEVATRAMMFRARERLRAYLAREGMRP
ncbi:MAG TPA: RNA polymerase sigma factor [Candidatus Limnocylindrales bacterium]|nr:RNA polymerase sigma factor [Candidatus Limnocylindrales bacterium]